jgi:sugar phosphate isomerase/epimerase
MEFAIMVGSSDVATLRSQLEAAASAGYDAVQIEPPPPLMLDDRTSIIDELERLGLRLVAIGGYANQLDTTTTDPLARLREAIALAPRLNCPVVVTWSGTHNTDLFEDHPENTSADTWRSTVATFKDVAAWAERANVTVAIEPFHNHVARTPDRLRQLLKDVGSRHLAAVMDPPNFVKADAIETVNSQMPSMFAALHGHIAIAHAKDLRRPDVGDTEFLLGGVMLPGPGQGILDYAAYGALLAQHGVETLVLEHIGPDTFASALRFVRAQFGTAE